MSQSPTLRNARIDAADAYTDMEALEDQDGSGIVLVFTFTAPVHLIWVYSAGAISRAIVGTQTPSATLGVFCDADLPTPIVVQGSSVKVFAPSGATVSVYGCKYTT